MWLNHFMRKLILKMSVTVDGFVADRDRDNRWIFPSMSEDGAAWTLERVSAAGAHLMGRSTYLEMASYWPTSTDRFAAPMNEIPKVVFSRTLEKADWPETRIASGDLAEEIARLKEEPGKDLVAHGGSAFARALTAAGLVDEYQLLVHPVALGEGMPLFGGRVDLDLVAVESFSGGAVAHTYRPATG
jgi:dihydrofolate reductase